MVEKCYYFVEGECEKQLVNALKQPPARLIPRRIRVLNITQELIPKSVLLTIQPGTTVTLVFDTDKPEVQYLNDNIKRIGQYCKKPRIVCCPQVLNFEDEMVRCTDVSSATELTRSRSVSNFKSAFCGLKVSECRHLLERHHIETARLWSASPPGAFALIANNSKYVKARP